jgi:hypothetical protein
LSRLNFVTVRRMDDFECFAAIDDKGRCRLIVWLVSTTTTGTGSGLGT